VRRTSVARLGAAFALAAVVALTPSSATAGYQCFSFGGAGSGWWNLSFWQRPTPARTTFAVHAQDLTGLYPGAVKSFRLTVDNPNSYPIRVTELGGTLSTTSNRTCRPTPSNLVVRPRQGNVRLPLTVPARSSRGAGEIPLYMPNTVADACQRTSFVIRFNGSAEKVDRPR
jgi:hypothetical protein